MRPFFNKYQQRLTVFIFIWSIFGVALSYSRILFAENLLMSFVTTSVYFTIQSNLLVAIVLLLTILKKDTRILSFITLVNITMTGLVFHVFLTDFMTSVSFINHVTHTITPLVYLLYFLLVDRQRLMFRLFWIGLVYPALYLLFVYGIVAPVLGQTMSSMFPDLQAGSYVYPFLNPDNYANGILGLSLFIGFIMVPLVLILSSILMALKHFIHTRLFHEKS